MKTLNVRDATYAQAAPAMPMAGKPNQPKISTGPNAICSPEPMAITMRTSTDSGATWSRARLIVPEHGFRQMVGEPVFRTKDGAIAFGADASGGSTIWVSRDGGETWHDPGGTIAGIHAGI